MDGVEQTKAGIGTASNDDCDQRQAASENNDLAMKVDEINITS